MFRISIGALIFLTLAACGGGGGGGGSAPQVNSPVAVTITKSANGCLLSHNADAVSDFQLGAIPARTLLWNCANIASRTGVGAEAFFTFSGTQQCYIERAVAWKAGNCLQSAAAPAVPNVAATVAVRGTPLLQRIGGGSYALTLDADITNSGNVSLFGATLTISSAPGHFADLRSIGDTGISGPDYLLPSRTFLSFGAMQIISNATTTGQDYRITLAVRDFAGNAIGSTEFNLTAP